MDKQRVSRELVKIAKRLTAYLIQWNTRSTDWVSDRGGFKLEPVMADYGEYKGKIIFWRLYKGGEFVEQGPLRDLQDIAEDMFKKERKSRNIIFSKMRKEQKRVLDETVRVVGEIEKKVNSLPSNDEVDSWIRSLEKAISDNYGIYQRWNKRWGLSGIFTSYNLRGLRTLLFDLKNFDGDGQGISKFAKHLKLKLMGDYDFLQELI